MTLVIQVFVNAEVWVTHGFWAACFLMLLRFGHSAVSVGRFLGLDGAKRAEPTKHAGPTLSA